MHDSKLIIHRNLGGSFINVVTGPLRLLRWRHRRLVDVTVVRSVTRNPAYPAAALRDVTVTRSVRARSHTASKNKEKK